MLCTEPILIAPNMNKPFYISVDASDFAVGAILEQKKNNKMHPVAYASRNLKGAELRYSTYDKEILINCSGLYLMKIHYKYYNK